jgi:hypothetical protein
LPWACIRFVPDKAESGLGGNSIGYGGPRPSAPAGIPVGLRTRAGAVAALQRGFEEPLSPAATSGRFIETELALKAY